MIRKVEDKSKWRFFLYFLLLAVIAGSIFVRIYNTKDILGFYYDQGRDALVIWNFIHNKDLFLVGPTTGIEGILRGPWYYWLVLPFYFLGRGNPVWPANFLALISVAAIISLFFLGKKIFDEATGLVAVIIASFSYYLIVASRWLSNPTPMLLISMLLVLSMLAVAEGKKIYWMAIAVLLALSMQFGSATEAFYIPAVALFAVWQRKNLPDARVFVISILLALAVFLPQIVFDFLKGGVLVSAVRKFLFEEESFKLSFWEVIKVRLPFYWEMFMQKIWIGKTPEFIAFFMISFSALIFNFKKLWKRNGFRILILLGVSPLVGMIFFQGNEGNVFDYYFTGYYLIYVLIFSAGLGLLARNKFGIAALLIFFYLFAGSQFPVITNYLVSGRSNVGLKEQLAAIEWIYADSGGKKFNVDVYVPPVIPYAYDYLIIWKSQEYGRLPSKEKVGLLYTLYEEDVPVRLNPWLLRQEKTGRILKEVSFRGLTVQRRERF